MRNLSIQIVVRMEHRVSVYQCPVGGIRIAGFGKPHFCFKIPEFLKVREAFGLLIPTFLQVDRTNF